MKMKMKMKISTSLMALFLVILVVLPDITSSRHINHPRRSYRNPHRLRGNIMGKPAAKARGSGPDTVEIAGSSLPDCSHACGSCSPCRLVMVSFVCAALEEAETCPMAYKCMCKNKSYPVP